MTAEKTKAMEEWRDLEKTMIPNREDAKENTRKMKSDYATVAGYLRSLVHHHPAGPGREGAQRQAGAGGISRRRGGLHSHGADDW